MKRKSLVFNLIFCFLVFLQPSNKIFSLDISASAYVLYCPENGKVILEKNSHKKMPMASTTKIMTALLAFETSVLYDECIAIEEKMLQVEGSSMGLKARQILPISSLAKGALTVSGNDAANAIAISLGGTLENFANLMNLRAKELKMYNTNFVTPSGLDAKNHFSTAYDLALLASEAVKNKSFLKTVSSLKTDISFKNPRVTLPFYNENKLLKKYKGCLGIKTGFTKASGRCLVSCAERENLRLIAVTLNAPDDWNDHTKLFDYGFSNFKAIVPKEEKIFVPLVGGKEEEVLLTASCPLKMIVNINENPKISTKVTVPKFLYAPLEKNKSVGEISYFVDDKEYKKIKLVTNRDYEKKNKKQNFFEKIKNTLKNIKNKLFKR